MRRLINLWRRRRRARQLGFQFGRTSTLNIPSELAIGGKIIRLNAPADNGTRSAFLDVMLDDCYGIQNLPHDVRTVADIGCHVAFFALAARERWPHAVIHGYEPNPELKRYYSRHAAQAGITIYPEAVSARSGTAVLLSQGDSVHARTADADNGELIRTGLGEVLDRLGGQADLVKLDCEGAEWQILSHPTAWRRVRMLTMEFHLWAGGCMEQLLVRVRMLGFTIRRCQMTGRDFGLLVATRHWAGSDHSRSAWTGPRTADKRR